MTPAKKRSASRSSASLLASDQFTGFPPRALTFLRGLAKNNRKEWFEAHRDDYELSLRAPMRLLIEEVDVRLAAAVPEIVGSAKKSMFRIHRDVRFSKDKSPYKTNAACWFFHRDAGGGVGGDAAHGGAGFYFHLAPQEIFCGGGIWMPPRPALTRIRAALADDHEEFEGIVLDRAFVRRFGPLDPERMLTRLPRGVAVDHPAAKWMRYQSFTAGCALTVEQVQSAKLPDVLMRHFEALSPFIRYLNNALGLRPNSAR
ncbi:MAG: DUF2461 domain-containing protein [Gemmatimonadaceae bacterium]|nr:DUF2461 domain-containing protein [Gemmatimonadaceae bacterium]